MPQKSIVNRSKRTREENQTGVMTRAKRRKLDENFRMLNVCVLVKNLTTAEIHNFGNCISILISVNHFNRSY